MKFHLCILLWLVRAATGHLRSRYNTTTDDLQLVTTSLATPDTTEYFCFSNYECPPHSSCGQYNRTTGICECDDAYATLTTFCQYKRKSALVGLLLTIFLQELAPLGRMYALSGITSTDQEAECTAVGELFTCGLLGTLLIVVPTALLLCWFTSSDDLNAITKLLSILVLIITFIWWITDVVGFANNTIKDENGVALMPV